MALANEATRGADDPAADGPLGLTPTVEWLRADTLRPWHLQRAIKVGHVRQIARDFDPDMLDPLKISRREGVDYVLDGQHRLRAIIDELGWGEQNVPCLVYVGLTDKQETSIFHAQGPGVRRQLSAIHDFHVVYQGGDPEARRIVATVERAGLHMDWTHGRGAHSVRAVGALKRIAAQYGHDWLHEVLVLLRDVLGPEARAYSNDIIRGGLAFHSRYRGLYAHADLVAKVRPHGVDGVLREARNYQAVTGGAIDAGIGRALRKLYNHGRRTRLLPDWEANAMPADVRAAVAAKMIATRRRGAR